MRRNTNVTGLIALVGLGLYYAFRNRFQIQQFLESQGIKTNLDTSNLGNTVKSGIAKVRGRIKFNVKEGQEAVREGQTAVNDRFSNIRRSA